MKKKERVLVELLRYPLEELCQRELKYVKNELQNLVEELRTIPIGAKVVIRRYGFTEEELVYFINKREYIYKEVDRLMPSAKKLSSIYPRDRIREDLEENKWKIIELYTQGCSRKEIYDDIRTYPCNNAWLEFKTRLVDEGYIKDRRPKVKVV